MQLSKFRCLKINPETIFTHRDQPNRLMAADLTQQLCLNCLQDFRGSQLYMIVP